MTCGYRKLDPQGFGPARPVAKRTRTRVSRFLLVHQINRFSAPDGVFGRDRRMKTRTTTTKIMTVWWMGWAS